MPRSSRHKSHKQSKHTSKDYSDSEEDVKAKDKRSKDENLIKVRDSLSGEKRKISSLFQEGKEVREKIAQGNGDASEDYGSSKRRKEKCDIGIGVDRWNGGGEERSDNDRIAEKETLKLDGYKVDSKSKEVRNKGESSRISSKHKSRKYESGGAGEFRDEILTSAVLEKEDIKSKVESKRKSERDYSLRKEGKEFREKDHRIDKEKDHRIDKEKEKDKSLGQESRRRDSEMKLVDRDGGKKLVPQSGDHQEEKQEENPDFLVHDQIKIHELEKDNEKKLSWKRDSFRDRGQRDDFKESDERVSLSRSVRSKDANYRDEKHDKYSENVHKNNEQRNLEETKKDIKHKDDKHGEDVEKDVRRRDDRSRGESVRDNRSKDEKRCEGERDAKRKDDKHCDGERDTKRKDDKHWDGERDTKRKDDKHRVGVERDWHRDYKHRDDSGKDSRRKDEHFREDGDKDAKHKNVKYYEDGDRYDIIWENKYKEDDHRDNTKKEEKHREDTERGRRYKDYKQGGEFNGEKRPREAKHNEKLASGDRSGEKFDSRHSIDDLYTADHHSKKSSAFDVSPTKENHTVKYRDDQGTIIAYDKEDFSDVRSGSSKDQRFDAEKKIGSGASMNSVHERGSSTSRNAELEQNASHRRRCSSPSSSSFAPRDHYRFPKQDEFWYRDYSYEERLRHHTTPSRDYTGTVGGSEKPLSSRSLEKLGQKEDGDLWEFSAEKRLISETHLSPVKPSGRSPLSSTDKRHLSRSNTRLSIDAEESAHRSGGSREVRDYSGKEFKESHDLAMDRFPGDELSQADTDTISVSSPFARNNLLSISSKSFAPPPLLRTVVDSPLISCSVEDDNIFKLSSRFRRGLDPYFERNQGNTWRGVSSWPSPVANGFMSFPHPPPPASFPPAMQPLPVLPLYGMRPSMELNHPIPFHISDTDRYSGPVRPMEWHNPVGDSQLQMHAWDPNSAVYRNESHIYGRPGLNNSRNIPVGHGWDTTVNMWKRPSKISGFEMSSFEKEGNFTQNVNDALAGQSIESSQTEQIDSDHLEVSTNNHLIYGTEIVTAEALHTDLETNDIAKSSKKDDAPLCQAYLSRLDISADLTEPELFNQCSEFIRVDRSDVSYMDGSKILLIEGALEAEVASCQILSYSLPVPLDYSLFQRAMFLYKRQKVADYEVGNTERFFIGDQPIPEADQENLDIEVGKTDGLSAKDDPMELTSESHTKDECCAVHANQTTDITPTSSLTKSDEPVSTLNQMQVDLASMLPPQDHIVDEPLTSESSKGLNARSDASPKVKHDGNIEELVQVIAKCDTLLNSNVCSDAFEANLPESVAYESVNLSRIHHSPESTH